jgi:hypothetical protein
MNKTSGLDREGYPMKTLRMIVRWLHDVLAPGMGFSYGIDTHRWESKMEVLRHLSGGCC